MPPWPRAPGSYRAVGLAMAMMLAAPAWAGPPFETDDPEPVEPGHWEVYLYSLGTFVHGDTAGQGPATEINYGAAPGVQLHLTTGLAYNSQSLTGTESGVGDTTLGTKLRFIDQREGEWWPEVGVFPMLALPSGNQARGLGTGRVHEYLPVWVQKDFGPWSTYGGGGWWHNPGPGNKDYWFFGALLQRQVADDLLIGGELFHQTASITDVPGTVGYPLGARDTTGFNLGGVYDFNEHYHLLLSAGTGLQKASSTNVFTYYLGVQWTF